MTKTNNYRKQLIEPDQNLKHQFLPSDHGGGSLMHEELGVPP